MTAFPGFDLSSLTVPLVHDVTFRRLCRARDLLAADYQSPVLLAQAAREACLSTFHFHRLFTSTFGETPHDFLTRLRMDRARDLLACGEMSITEICMEVGYSSLGSFSLKFHGLIGQTPSEYRRQARKVFGFSIPWRILYIPDCFVGAFALFQ